tara:strand:- start:40 stop:450 length:411 start_codon:yes stop_codon:yes gene_type:complete
MIYQSLTAIKQTDMSGVKVALSPALCVDVAEYIQDMSYRDIQHIRNNFANVMDEIASAADSFFERKISKSDDFEWAAWSGIRDGGGIYGDAMNAEEYHSWMNEEDICNPEITYEQNMMNEIRAGTWLKSSCGPIVG